MIPGFNPFLTKAERTLLGIESDPQILPIMIDPRTASRPSIICMWTELYYNTKPTAVVTYEGKPVGLAKAIENTTIAFAQTFLTPSRKRSA